MNQILFIILAAQLSVAKDNVSNYKSFVRENNLLTSTLYKELITEEQGNVVVSPIAVEIATGLAQFGAKNATAEEIPAGVHLPETDKRTKSIIKKFFKSLLIPSPCKPHIFNRMFFTSNMTVKHRFKKMAQEIYQFTTAEVNFSNTVLTADDINHWAYYISHEKITPVIDSDLLNNQMSLIFITVFYFEGSWAECFDPTNTKKMDFYKTPTIVLQVDTMFKENMYVGYYESSKLNATFLGLRFESVRDEYLMVIVLPNKDDEFASLESENDVFCRPKLKYELMDITLPKFKIEKNIILNGILKKLGMNLGFSVTDADFSRMGGQNSSLKIDIVVQHTLFHIDENGSEFLPRYPGTFFNASSSTTRRKVIVDRPFIFYIVFKNLVLMAGRVVDPEE